MEKNSLVKCRKCGDPTSWRHAWRNGGKCKTCVEAELSASRAADERRARILARTREAGL